MTTTEKVGYKIKQLREEKEMSLNELSENSKIHKSQLELIERGELMPSLATLVRLARVMGIRVGTILDGEENCNPVITHANDRPRTAGATNAGAETGKNLDFFSLGQGKTDRNMEPFIVEIEYGSSESECSQHEGEEFFYVLEGTLELHYGQQTHTLSQGDSIYFNSIVPHSLTTPAAGSKAKILAVIYTPF